MKTNEFDDPNFTLFKDKNKDESEEAIIEGNSEIDEDHFE